MKKLLLSLCTLVFAVATMADEKVEYRRDPKKIVTADKCGNCHQKEAATWKKTQHFKTFDELSKKPDAKKIMANLGIKNIKQKEGKCWECHFTVQHVDGKNKPVAGISCEGCHGAAKEWLNTHNTVPAAERAKKMEPLGMIHPDRAYFVAENCYQCHTISDETLVNKGGHKATSNFNLVGWSQGEVRHNFITGGNKKNVEASIEKKRRFFIMGEVMELEFGLRGIAEATDEKGVYFIEMKKKVQAAAKQVKLLSDKTQLPELQDMLKSMGGVKLNANNKKQILDTAEKVRKTAIALSDKYTGKEPGMAKVDEMLKTIKYQGKVNE